MEKLITALNNNYINKKLKENGKYEVKYNDISYQEGIFEILNIEKIDVILLSEILEGPYNIKELIKKIKEKDNEIEIVVILEKKNFELEKFLKDHNINNYFYNNQLSVEKFNNLKFIPSKINLNIEEIKSAILKSPKNKSINSLKKENLLNNLFLKIKNKIINLKIYFNKKEKKKYIYSFSGKDSLIKSIFILILSLILKKKNKKVLNIDLDFLNQNINTLFGVQKFPNIKNLDFNNILEVNKNIYYLLNLKDVIENNYDKFISKINELKNEYDYIFINLSSINNLMLNKKILEISDYNFFIFNKEKNDILYNNNLLRIYTNEWKIKINKFICIFNSEIDKNKNHFIMCGNLNNSLIEDDLMQTFEYFNQNYIDEDVLFNLNLEKCKINRKIKKKYYNLIKKIDK